MFYYLLLAHLLADYPLQPDWVIFNKTQRGVLALHIIIHFLTSVIIVWIFSSTIGLSVWPYLLLLAGIHFLIDSFKSKLSRIRPKWVKIPYVVDQLVHVFSIAIIAFLIQNQFGFIAFPANSGWVVLSIAYLLVTYVWYISERVLTYDKPVYRQSVIHDSWSRMLFRSGLLTGLLGLWILSGKTLVAPASSMYIPYQAKQFGRRALLTDVVVTLGVFILIVIVLDWSF